MRLPKLWRRRTGCRRIVVKKQGGIRAGDLRRIVRRARRIGLGDAPVYVRTDLLGRCQEVSVGNYILPDGAQEVAD